MLAVYWYFCCFFQLISHRREEKLACKCSLIKTNDDTFHSNAAAFNTNETEHARLCVIVFVCCLFFCQTVCGFLLPVVAATVVWFVYKIRNILRYRKYVLYRILYIEVLLLLLYINSVSVRAGARST